MNRILPILPWIFAAAIFGPAAVAADLSGPELVSPWETIERLPPTGETGGDWSIFRPTDIEAPTDGKPKTSTCPLRAAEPLLATPLEENRSAETPPAEMPLDDRMATPLAAAPRFERSEQLEQVARQADRHTRHGCELAGRGAYFAARSEFLAALKLVAEALDAEQRTDSHGRALQAAMTAMKEAEDFLPSPSRIEGKSDLARAIASHATPVLKDRAEQIDSMTALKCYFTFSQQQFAAAAGREVAGSMALHSLGKLHGALAQAKSGLVPAAEPKAMVFHQAALLVYPNNFMAANDLGVLLAKNGEIAGARSMLEYSLALQPQSTGWRNLAVVYRQLGHGAAAQQAERRAEIAEQTEIARRKQVLGTASTLVQWADPSEFARTSANTPSSPGAIAARSATAEATSRKSLATDRMTRGSPAFQR